MRVVLLSIFLFLLGCGGGGNSDNMISDVESGDHATDGNSTNTLDGSNTAPEQQSNPSVAGFYTLRAAEAEFVCVGGPPSNDPYGPTADNIILSQSGAVIEIQYRDGLVLVGTIDRDGIFEASATAPAIHSIVPTYDLAGAIEDGGYWSGQLTVTLRAASGYTCITTPFFSGQRGEVLTSSVPTLAPGECIDTAPINDGFGWNGVESCSLPAAPTTTPFVDRNCSDFPTQAEAQTFFENNGANDPHVLDLDNDGVACECNVGGGGWAWCPVVPITTPPNTPFIDRNCSDFTTQAEAQAFFLSEGGPAEDPHRLDGDGDGRVCVSLP